MTQIYISIKEQKTELSELLSKIGGDDIGGLVTFCGIVRKHNHNKDVAFLQYESHPELAEIILREIAVVASIKWPLFWIIVVHRTGRLEIGETAVSIITASTHRKESYEASQYIINKLKQEVPIWKKETYVDGTSEWGNLCNCDKNNHQPSSSVELLNHSDAPRVK